MRIVCGTACAFFALSAAASGMPARGRVIPVEGTVAEVVRASALPASAREFTVAFRFRPAHYVKRPGPWEGLVFANGNGWSDGFRATITPEVNTSLDGFRMNFRVVKPEGGAVIVPIHQELGAGRWYHVAFVLGGGELKSYLNGTLNAKRKFDGGFKKPSCDFSVGAAGFGVGFYPFATADFITWEHALGDDEVLALTTGGETSAKGVKRFLEGCSEAEFADMRSLAWNTAKRLADAGDRRAAAELYARLAREAPASPTVDGGNEVAARLAKEIGGFDVEPAVKYPEIVPFAGYGAFEDAEFKPDVERSVFVAPDGDDANGTGTAVVPLRRSSVRSQW